MSISSKKSSKSKTQKIKEYFNSIALERERWKKKNRYYHEQIEKLVQFLVPRGKRVLDIGCGDGNLLASLKPNYGVGVDIAEKMVTIAKKKHKKENFLTLDAQNLYLQEKFDYIVMSDIIGNLEDVQGAFEELHKVATENTRIIITYYNFLWEPVLNSAEKLGLKMPQPLQNWLSRSDIKSLLFLANFEVIREGSHILVPQYLPLISNLANKYLARLPFFRNLCLVQYFVARKNPNIYQDKDYSVSVIIPARNETGNIEQAVLRTPNLGKSTEIIFVEGGSADNTLQEIKRVIKKYKGQKDIKLVEQGEEIGKVDAVRKGFAEARGDILMILDADLTVQPEDLLKFYQAIRARKGELIMGSRLVYPMEREAMRLLNIFGNKFFSLAFSWLLDQKIKDTLCGTKVLFRKDYVEISRNRSYFGDFDPFGDFDLIFGAAKLNLKVIEIPIVYQARTYGTTNISRFRHGWLLSKMTFFAAKKIKFF